MCLHFPPGLGFYRINFVFVFLLFSVLVFCFALFLFLTSLPTLYLNVNPTPEPMKELKKSGPLVRAGGPKLVQMACQRLLAHNPAALQVRAAPTPAAPQQQSPGKMGSVVQEWMALLLWKPALRNRSELIHSGEQPGLGGGGEAKLRTLNFALLLPACDAGQVT